MEANFSEGEPLEKVLRVLDERSGSTQVQDVVWGEEPERAECVSRVRYNHGSFVVVPLPVAFVTTTEFCFDSEDRLRSYTTERWGDGP